MNVAYQMISSNFFFFFSQLKHSHSHMCYLFSVSPFHSLATFLWDFHSPVFQCGFNSSGFFFLLFFFFSVQSFSINIKLALSYVVKWYLCIFITHAFISQVQRISSSIFFFLASFQMNFYALYFIGCVWWWWCKQMQYALNTRLFYDLMCIYFDVEAKKALFSGNSC